MANLATVLGSLESYLHNCLKGMTIDSKPSKRFRKRQGGEVARNPIEELSGPSRLYQFECENPEIVQEVYSGSTHSGRVYRFVLKILYSSYEGWMQAALSDHSTLSHYVLDNPSSATGIQSVVVESNPEITRPGNDPWFILNCKIKAFLEIGE